MTPLELARDIVAAFIAKSGVREWQDAETRAAIADATVDLVMRILYGPPPWPDPMALPDYFKVEPGTAKTIKSSSGDAAITLTSVANAAARQAATLDLGANWARRWRLEVEYELAATPTAGNTISHLGSWQNASGGGQGNTSGSDAAYTGYSSNIDASIKQLEFLGDFVCTAQATATVQKGLVGVIVPKARYLNLVVYNNSGAAFHSSATNIVIRLTPLEDLVQDAV